MTFIHVASCNNFVNTTNVIPGTLNLGKLHITYDGSYITSLNFSRIVEMALEVISRNKMLEAYSVSLTLYGDECDAVVLVEDTIQKAKNSGINVLFGPVNTISGTSITELATEAGIVLINSFRYLVSASEEHHDEEDEEVPLFANVISDYLRIVDGIKATLVTYGWRKIAIGQTSIHEHDRPDMLTMGEQLEKVLKEVNITTAARESLSSATGLSGLKRGLQQYSGKARSKYSPYLF